MIRFEDFDLSPELLKALDKLGFKEAFPIQEQSIPVSLSGKDVIGLASTGTGKTIAFSIPMIEAIDLESNATQGLIVCPTRELAVQVADEIKKLSKYTQGLNVSTIYGGQRIDIQYKQLKKGAHIVVGTPGRILDHIKQGTLKLNNVSMAVLDEADEMLSMGFRGDIEAILKTTPKERQTMLFSATMSPDILRLTKRFQNNPETVKVENTQDPADSLITHTFFNVDKYERTGALAYLLDTYNPKQAIVFCNTRRRVKKVAEQLGNHGYKAEVLHGEVRQTARNRILESFKAGKTKVVIATDVAARGIDVASVEAVINYELPKEIESYVHRSGRTGRAGRTGNAFSFVDRETIRQIGRIEHQTGVLFNKEELPSKNERSKSQSNKFLVDLRQIITTKNLKSYTQAIEEHIEEFKDNINAVDIAAALLHMKFNAPLKSSLADEPRGERRGGAGGGGRNRERRSSGGGDRKYSSGSRGGGFPKRKRKDNADSPPSNKRRDNKKPGFFARKKKKFDS